MGELTLDAVRRGEITLPDLRIHPESLEHQARVALEHGNPQLADNLRRAAELTALGDDEVLAIYEALRPGRSTAAQLTALAAALAGRGLPLRGPAHRGGRDLRAAGPDRMTSRPGPPPVPCLRDRGQFLSSNAPYRPRSSRPHR